MSTHTHVIRAVKPAVLFPATRDAVAEGGRLIRLALPMTAAALVNMGMAITDVAMMGRLGPDAVAAGAIVSDLYSIVYYLGAGTIAAIAPEIAQAIGAGRGFAIRRVTQQGLWMAAIIAALSLALLWNATSFLALVGIDGAITGLAQGYARAMALTAVPMMGVSLWRCVYGALSRPRVFLIATIIALPANAALDYVLMFGGLGIPALGVTGAGIASAVVALGMLVGLTVHARLSLALRPFRLLARFRGPDPRRLVALFRIGVPMGISGFTEVGVFLISTMLAGLFGAESLAAHAVTLRMAGVVYALPLGLSQAATVRVGYAIGEGREDNIRRAAQIALTLGVLGGAVTGAALVALSGWIPELFLSSAAESAVVAEAASGLLVILAVICLIQGLGVVAMGVLRGFKDTRIPMLIGIFGFWGIGMGTVLGTGFAAGYGVAGIWTGIATGAAVTAGLAWLRLRRRLAAASPGDPFSFQSSQS